MVQSAEPGWGDAIKSIVPVTVFADATWLKNWSSADTPFALRMLSRLFRPQWFNGLRSTAVRLTAAQTTGRSRLTLFLALEIPRLS